MNNKTIVTLLGFGAWVALGACSSEGDHPPLNGEPPLRTDAGGSSSSGGSGSSSGSSGGEDGATPLDGAIGPTDSAFYDGPVTPATDASMTSPMCSPNQKWGTPANVAGLPTFPSQPLVTITNDELTAAWVVDSGNGEGSVYYADRASTSDPFGTATQLVASVPGGSFIDGLAVDGGQAYFAFDRVGLSSDGLRLVGVAVGSLHLAEFDRGTRTGLFNAMPVASSFTELSSALMAGEKLGDPVLAPSGKELVYSRYGLSPAQTIYDSFLAGQDWPAGSGESMTALEASNGQRKHPTSMTADGLALFVWDDAGQAYGVLRPSAASEFNYAIPFGARFSIQVNGVCSRIYFVASNGASGYVVQQADSM
jgi:hypothetical protein